jgi:hypothetical protein
MDEARINGVMTHNQPDNLPNAKTPALARVFATVPRSQGFAFLNIAISTRAAYIGSRT